MSPTHWILITVIIAWSLAMWAGAWQATQKELMKHRERLAMIEKGLPLPAEEPPGAQPLQTLMGTTGGRSRAENDQRMVDAIRFLGIMTIAGGIAVWFLLMILDQWNAGVGIGGMMVILGAALVITTMRAVWVKRRDQ
jgi:hypothetical protein